MLYRSTIIMVIASLFVSPALAANDSSSDGFWKLVYNVYMEQIRNDALKGTPDDLIEYQTKLDALVQVELKNASPKPLKGFYKFSSPDVAVPPTDHRVDGDKPECGDGKAQLSDEVTQYLALLGAAAAAGDIALGSPGYIFFNTNLLLGIPIYKNNRYQTEANCVSVCAMVAAGFPESDLSISSYYRNTDHPDDHFQAFTIDENDWGNWRRFDGIDKDHTASLTYHSLKGNEKKECMVRLVCTRLRNWSHDHVRMARLEVSVDAKLGSNPGCSDFSVVSDEYLDLKVRAMPREKALTIFSRWRKAQGYTD